MHTTRSRSASFITACAAALLALGMVSTAHAQDAGKKELATRIVNLQKAQDMDALIGQLAASATQIVVQAWMPQLDKLPQAKQKAAADQLDAELKKFNEDNLRAIRAKNDRVATEVLVPAYSERFSADELRQIVTFLESPVIKKYYAATPQLGNLLAQRLVEATRPDVEVRVKAFDARAAQILGLSGKKQARTGQ